MPAKTAKTAQTAQPTADPVATTTTDPEPVVTDLVTLLVQQRQLADVIRRLKAAQPQPTPLERVIARQTRSYSKWQAPNMAERVRERMRAGQPRPQAQAAVVAFFVAQLDALLDADDDSEPETQAEQTAP